MLRPLTTWTFFESFPKETQKSWIPRIRIRINPFNLHRVRIHWIHNPFLDFAKETKNPVLDSESGLGFFLKKCTLSLSGWNTRLRALTRKPWCYRDWLVWIKCLTQGVLGDISANFPTALQLAIEHLLILHGILLKSLWCAKKTFLGCYLSGFRVHFFGILNPKTDFLFLWQNPTRDCESNESVPNEDSMD